MDPVARAIERLRSQKGYLALQRDAGIQRTLDHLDPGGKRGIKKIKERYLDRVEVIDYVLNILENTEEEPCQS